MLKRSLLTLAAMAVLVPSMYAQTPAPATTPAPTTDPFEAAWNVQVTGNYANVSNAPTNNGFLTGVSFRLSQHVVLRSDVYLLNSPQGMTLTLGGIEYRESLAHLFKSTSPFALNANKVEMFANVELGDAKTGTVLATSGGVAELSKSSFAYSVGGGFDLTLANHVTVRPLDIKYVRSTFLNGGGGVYGNQLDFAAGLGLRF